MTDTSAGLANLDPTKLTDAELGRYCELVTPDKLPVSWIAELASRVGKRRYIADPSI